jgi:hypothetical protein
MPSTQPFALQRVVIDEVKVQATLTNLSPLIDQCRVWPLLGLKSRQQEKTTQSLTTTLVEFWLYRGVIMGTTSASKTE